MINHIYVNGVRVDNEKTFIKKLGNITGAAVQFSKYQRGGVSGQALSRPLYGGLSISMIWTVTGSSWDDFITQRDRLVGYFQNLEDSNSYTKTLGIELSNGVIKEVDVLFTEIASDLDSSDILSDEFTLTAVSEKEYFTSRTAKTATLNLRSLGGMAVPMNVPMSMANFPVGDTTEVINAGNANAHPTITVVGAFDSGFDIINETGIKQFSYTGALLESDSLVIDFYNHTAILNATTNVLNNVSGDWLTLLPGTNTLSITGADGDSGSATVSYKDTYRNI
jgi:hypothetical protein